MKPAQTQKDKQNLVASPIPNARIEKSPCGKFEFVHPTVQLASKVSFKSSRGTDPMTAADHHVGNMAFEYADWVDDMRTGLNVAWQNYKQDPSNPSHRADLIAAVHVIKGNAPTIGYTNAGNLAGSLSKFLERALEWSEFEKPLGLCISAIMATLSEKGKIDSPQNLDMLNAIAVLVERKLAKAQAEPRS